MYLIFHWCAQITIITSSKWILLCQENINLTYFEKFNQFFFSFRTISRYAIYRGTIFFKDIDFCCISSYSYHNFPMVLIFGNFHVTLCKIARKYVSIEIKYSDYLFCAAAATGMNMVVWMGKYYVTEQLQWKNDENYLKESQKLYLWHKIHNQFGLMFGDSFECKTIGMGWYVWCKW